MGSGFPMRPPPPHVQAPMRPPPVGNMAFRAPPRPFPGGGPMMMGPPMGMAPGFPPPCVQARTLESGNVVQFRHTSRTYASVCMYTHRFGAPPPWVGAGPGPVGPPMGMPPGLPHAMGGGPPRHFGPPPSFVPASALPPPAIGAPPVEIGTYAQSLAALEPAAAEAPAPQRKLAELGLIYRDDLVSMVRIKWSAQTLWEVVVPRGSSCWRLCLHVVPASPSLLSTINRKKSGRCVQRTGTDQRLRAREQRCCRIGRRRRGERAQHQVGLGVDLFHQVHHCERRRLWGGLSVCESAFARDASVHERLVSCVLHAGRAQLVGSGSQGLKFSRSPISTRDIRRTWSRTA